MDNVFGLKKVEVYEPSGQKKSIPEQIRLLSQERDRLDIEIKTFREKVLSPTKTEHRYFVQLKEERKKLQIEIRRVRRFERRTADQLLHEQLNIMTKAELKQWRIMSHKLFNIEQNIESILGQISLLRKTSKFEGLLHRVQQETTTLNTQIQYYRASTNEVQSIVTKHFYRDKTKADEARIQSSPTTECKPSDKEDVTV